MAVDGGWELTAGTLTIGTDVNGRLVARGITVFTCPECDTAYELEVKLPLSAGDPDAEC